MRGASRERWWSIVVACLLVLPAACGEEIEECPDKQVPVELFNGEPPERTVINCDGEYFSSLCGRDLFTYVSQRCDGQRLLFTVGATGANAVTINLDENLELASARISLGSDEEGSGRVIDAESGSVQVSINADSSVLGSFELQFPATVMVGAFNSTFEPGDL